MNIAEIQAGQGKIDIIAKVIEIGELRTFDKFGKQGKVCSAKIKDESGEIALTLWNDQTEQIKVGNTIKITNGYASEFKGERQLSTGKFGTLEVIEEAEAPASTTSEPEKKAPETNPEPQKPSPAENDGIEEERVG
ncbi:MAG: SOSS complex subunit B family protein [Candidatus Woesearchaeota archaeon]